MNELSLHILDIAQNSITAGASCITIDMLERQIGNRLEVTVTDDGSGMSAEMLENVTSPFTTSRKTRKVGLGIPLLKMTAELTGGRFDIESTEGKGTKLYAEYDLSSVDCLPIGDMGATMMLLVQQTPETRFIYRRQRGEQSFTLDTLEIARELDGVPLDTPDVLAFIESFVNENERELNGGAL